MVPLGAKRAVIMCGCQIRLNNTISTEIETHEAAIALHFIYYNFVGIHQTLPVTPTMEAKVADHVWSLEEIVSLLD